MNTYLVYRYRQVNGAITWTGSGWRGRIHDMAIYPVWQVRAPSLREAVRQTRDEWARRQRPYYTRLPACNEAPEVVQ